MEQPCCSNCGTAVVLDSESAAASYTCGLCGDAVFVSGPQRYEMTPQYTCSVCKLAVLVVPQSDGNHQIIRGCAHHDAVVHANLSAHVLGVSDLRHTPR